MEHEDHPCTCPVKCKLQKTSDKLTFLREHCSMPQCVNTIGSLDEKDLKCLLCLINVVIDALANDEYWCPNKEIIRLVMLRTFVENAISLNGLQAEVKELCDK